MMLAHQRQNPKTPKEKNVMFFWLVIKFFLRCPLHKLQIKGLSRSGGEEKIETSGQVRRHGDFKGSQDHGKHEFEMGRLHQSGRQQVLQVLVLDKGL